MASYTLHLGFTWNSQLLGSIWGEGPASEYRALQYALARADGAPAWFQFEKHDVLDVMIWDLSSEASAKDLTLSMGFSALEAGGVATYDPAKLVSSEYAHALQGSKGNWYLRFTNAAGTIKPDDAAAGAQGPWGESNFVYTAGPLTFIADASYDLSFSLNAAIPDGGAQRTFIGDPEVIVGSRGG